MPFHFFFLLPVTLSHHVKLLSLKESSQLSLPFDPVFYPPPPFDGMVGAWGSSHRAPTSSPGHCYLPRGVHPVAVVIIFHVTYLF